MPGASLWLLPPSTAQITSTLTNLIAGDIPNLLDKKAPGFEPHVTLTSDIELPIIGRAEEWLRDLIDQGAFTTPSPVLVIFEKVDTAQRFTKKLYIHCEKSGEEYSSLRKLAAICRQASSLCSSAAEAEQWVAKSWDPHVSLLYSAIDLSPENIKEAKHLLATKDIFLHEHGNQSGWSGGRIWLVDTSKPIQEWKMLASLEL